MIDLFILHSTTLLTRLQQIGQSNTIKENTQILISAAYTILMGRYQMLLLQLRFDIYSVLN